MYIKLYNSDLDTVNKGYIYRTIRSIFIDQKRKEQEFVPIDSITLQLPNDTTTERRFELLEMLKTVSFFEREVLIQTHEKSLRDCEKDTNISFQFFHYHKKKALSKLQNKYNGRTGTNG
jgi:DNA-directed RNA polymerase specialized sigma24 family protein